MPRQFSLKTLLWLMACVCLVCAMVPRYLNFIEGLSLGLVATFWTALAWDTSGYAAHFPGAAIKPT